MQTILSSQAYAKAQKLMPGGVNSPVRACRAVGGQPLFMSSGHGSQITDIDGNSYLDLVGSWGPLILGHAHPLVINAVRQAAGRGLTFGACCCQETELAELVQAFMPGMEKLRLVSSGTEATMSAIRAARGYTGRPKIIKFIGAYHGHADCLLVKAGSGAATFSVPDSAGVPASATNDTLVLAYNDIQAVQQAVDQYPQQIAAIIVEPVAGNMGVVLPKPGYLKGLRDITAANGILLIFDEVMTGFRVARGGAQELYGIKPDLTTLGKIVGGGMPLAAYGGRAEIMEVVSPLGEVYQAGTLSGNPVSLAAGIATLKVLQSSVGIYERLEELGSRLETSFTESLAKHSFAARVQRVGSMLTVFFTDQPVTDLTSAQTCKLQVFAAYYQSMLERGVYLPPSQFESAFLNTALSNQDAEQICLAFEDTIGELACQTPQ